MAAEDYIGDWADGMDEAAADDSGFTLGVDELLAETDKAWKVQIHGEPVAWWVPKSQCWLSEDRQVLEIPTWLQRLKRRTVA